MCFNSSQKAIIEELKYTNIMWHVILIHITYNSRGSQLLHHSHFSLLSLEINLMLLRLYKKLTERTCILYVNSFKQKVKSFLLLRTFYNTDKYIYSATYSLILTVCIVLYILYYLFCFVLFIDNFDKYHSIYMYC